MRRRPPLWPPQATPPSCRAHESLRRGEFFGTYLAQLPDLEALRPLGRGRPERLFSHPGWSLRVLLLAAGGRLRPHRLYRRCSAPLRHVAWPSSCTGLDLRFLVAGPGFEPGKTIVGDFTDRGRYCPDLGERQSNPPFWHAFDMAARYKPPCRHRRYRTQRPTIRSANSCAAAA